MLPVRHYDDWHNRMKGKTNGQPSATFARCGTVTCISAGAGDSSVTLLIIGATMIVVAIVLALSRIER